ncbi:sensor histidine kinase [Tautonia rosea]|uniref:sensor histidine kinase n=1 Tax=Tautonia rosea TaxID=2728037 RepID=UPI0014732FC7|nr:ATP-binding protein [Tautonia rosea]
MSLARRLATATRKPVETLGAPGMIVGVVSVAALGFSLIVLAREYDRLRRTGREVSERSIESWARATPVDEVGRTLADYADAWRSQPDDPVLLGRVREALAALGGSAELSDPRFAVVAIERLELTLADGTPQASWFSQTPSMPGIAAEERRLILLDGQSESGAVPAVGLVVSYRAGALVEETLAGLETSYRRLLLAVLGLSGYSLLCLLAMVLQVRVLSDRAARESAQRATLDLADRTCHELGNVVFVLANERRNLANHLDQFDLLLDRLPDALADALLDAGIDPSKVTRVRRAFERRLADEGLDPEVDLRTGSDIARDVARQISVCSQYIALTVRELDGYLKQSSLPVEPVPMPVGEAIDEALTLLGPRIESASATVDRPSAEGLELRVRADRRLLVHALVNLFKNALEATSTTPSGAPPRITLSSDRHGPLVRIGVRDNGPGVPDAVAPRLFQAGTSTKGAGRGRGLAIASDSIQAQGGTLSLAPSNGSGACFLIELPAASDEPV